MPQNSSQSSTAFAPPMCADQMRAVHLIGACGSGMKALAELLIDRGCRVSGSDQNVNSHIGESLQRIGVTLFTGHRAEQVPADCQRVVFSPAVTFDNVERQQAQALGIPAVSLPQMLGELTRERPAACIAGTHGKSTTTALTGWLLQHAGRRPSVYCGAEVLGMSRSGWYDGGRGSARSASSFVVESCEFQRNFLQLHPRVAVLLGVDWDHVDCFASLEEMIAAFAEFLSRVPPDGLIVYNADCSATADALRRAVCDGARCRTVSFGTGTTADLCVEAIPTGWGSEVRLVPSSNQVAESHWSKDLPPIRLGIPGKHNALSAAACVLVAGELGLEFEEIAAGIASFSGVRRRLQWLGDWRGITLIDDYAHHPTAVRVGIETLRQALPQRPIRIVFQPHQVQRTVTFLEPFADALALADEVSVLPPYGARERTSAEGELAADRLVEAMGRRIGGNPIKQVRRLQSLDHVADSLQTDGRPGDVVVLMGAGSIERIADEFSGRLRRHHAG